MEKKYKKGTIVDAPHTGFIGFDYYKIPEKTVEEAIAMGDKIGTTGKYKPQFPRQLMMKLRLRWPWLTFVTFRNWFEIYRRHFFGNGDYILKLRKKLGGLKFIVPNKQQALPVVVWIHYFREYGELNLPEKSVIVDLGANIGTFSALILNEIPGARVYAYEPNPQSYKCYVRNMEINKFKNYSAFQKAVGGKNENRFFYTQDGMLDGSDTLYNYWPEKKPIKVDCVTLEQVFKDNSIEHCHLLKVDTEGAEYEMFFNTPDYILDKIDKIIIEWHLTDTRYKFRDLIDFLTDRGFDIQLDYPSRSLITATKNNLK